MKVIEKGRFAPWTFCISNPNKYGSVLPFFHCLLAQRWYSRAGREPGLFWRQFWIMDLATLTVQPPSPQPCYSQEGLSGTCAGSLTHLYNACTFWEGRSSPGKNGWLSQQQPRREIHVLPCCHWGVVSVEQKQFSLKSTKHCFKFISKPRVKISMHLILSVKECVNPKGRPGGCVVGASPDRPVVLYYLNK